jgi:cytochrome oxidase Cu insertion factor (SCO1/SenC/PrrC family)
MHRIKWYMASLVLTVLASSAAAQPVGNRSVLPEVGSPLPAIKLYDEHGDEFATTALRGHFSVLVFGCLT